MAGARFALELAVANGVELVVLTTHSDCAAEKPTARVPRHGGCVALLEHPGEA